VHKETVSGGAAAARVAALLAARGSRLLLGPGHPDHRRGIFGSQQRIRMAHGSHDCPSSDVHSSEESRFDASELSERSIRGTQLIGEIQQNEFWSQCHTCLSAECRRVQ